MSAALCLVDIGNSRIKWARYDGGMLLAGTPFATDAGCLMARLDSLWLGLDQPSTVYASNVAGPVIAAELERWVQDRWGIAVHFARSTARHSHVSSGYTTPEQLGVDRWLGLLGLHRNHVLPACLVDCGTALTADLLDADGRHRGGVIAPGMTTMRRSLHQDTHALGLVQGPQVAGAFGFDTASGIALGGALACAGLVEKFLEASNEALQQPVRLVMTGGEAALIGRHLSMPYCPDETIVLSGLLTLAESDL
ncbi:MAG: type III pantothenate kinase [Methylococcaceae bacterium]|nr:type III pantothenate kinase [Methylococcaceae bacterium]